MNTSSPGRRPWRFAPLVLSVVFVLIAGGVVGRALLRGDDVQPPVFSPPPSSATAAATPPPPCPAQPGDRSGANDGVLKIGTIFPQTGRELNSNGPQLTAATEMAVHDVTTQQTTAVGRVPGPRIAPLESELERDEGVPGSAATCAAAGALLANGVDAIVGPFASEDTLAVYGRVTGAGTLMVSPANTVNELSSIPDHGLYFRTASRNDVQGPALADLVADQGNDRVAVVASSETYATDLAGSVTGELKRRSVSATVLPYDREAPRFNDIADQIADQRFDGVVFIGFGEIADLVKILLNRGLTPQNTRMYGATGFVVNTFPEGASPGAPQLLDRFYGFVPWADPTFNEHLKDFRRSLQDLTYGAQAYDAVIAVALAAAAAGSDDPMKIAAELPSVTRGGRKCLNYAACVGLLAANPQADIDYDGVSGPLGFTPQGDLCQAVYLLSAFDTTKHLQAATPPESSPDECG